MEAFTDVPIDSLYSGVVSLEGFIIMRFLAELNKMDTWATNIESAYLDSTTCEKVFIVAGPEFAELQNCTLLVYKTL